MRCVRYDVHMDNPTDLSEMWTALREQRRAVAMQSGWWIALREQRRSLAWLADETGKSRRTVYGYSSGSLEPPAEWIADALRVLGVEAAA